MTLDNFEQLECSREQFSRRDAEPQRERRRSGSHLSAQESKQSSDEIAIKGPVCEDSINSLRLGVSARNLLRFSMLEGLIAASLLGVLLSNRNTLGGEP